MKLIVDRKWKMQNYTISNLFIDGEWFCNVLEDTDRGLKDSMSIEDIKKIKVASKTAIPAGTYKVTLDVFSNRFGNKTFYKNLCDGKLPRLLNVKGFDGILIHTGNTAEDTAGCLIVGKNTIKGKVTDSTNTFKALYQKLSKDKNNITIEIQ